MLDCVTKQCRAIQKSGWEKDADAVERLASASDKLVKLYLEVMSRLDFTHACMYILNICKYKKVNKNK